MPTIGPQFGNAIGSSSAIARPLVGPGTTSTVNSPLIVTARVNFAVEALKDTLSATRESKADTITRLQHVEATRMGARYLAMQSAAIADSAPGIWTPFGKMTLPIIHSSDQDDRRAELAIVLAMCNGADIQLRAELLEIQGLID